MKILIDIGHPAHVHYFKYTINKLQADGHFIFVIAREKEITVDLLKAYNIKFLSRGKGKDNIIGKFFYLFNGAFKVWKFARKNKIDLFLSFASPYNALASFFYRKPNITFDDTEHNVLNHKIYVPLSSAVLTPVSFKKKFGVKQIRFHGTMDSAYLHSKYFVQKRVKFDLISDKLPTKKKVIVRIVSWNASHDMQHSGFSHQDIIKLIEILSPYADIYISSEKKLPAYLSKFNININPIDMHNYMQEVDLFIGESGSMATEAAYLGTHSIVLHSASHEFGVFEWFSKYKTFYIAKDFEDLISSSIAFLELKTLSQQAKCESKLIQNNSLCLTDFMVWFIENYPESVKIMKENPDYQFNFK